jgi:hypothetical protein
MYVVHLHLPEEMEENLSQMPGKFILHFPILAPAGYIHVTITSTYSHDFVLQYITFVSFEIKELTKMNANYPSQNHETHLILQGDF